MKVYQLLVVFLLLITGLGRTQIPYFNVQFEEGNDLWQGGTNGVIETDSFYIISGFFTHPSIEQCDTGLIIRIDKFNLDIDYQKIGAGIGSRINNLIWDEQSNSIFVNGTVSSCHQDGMDDEFFLGRISLDTFSLLELKKFGANPRGEYPSHSIKDRIGDYVLVGHSLLLNETRQSILVFKADSNFHQIFYRRYPSSNPPYNYFGTGIIEADDGGYIIIGIHRLPDDEDAALIFEIDSMGTVQWWQEFDPNHDANEKNLFFSGIAKGEDGGYIVFGRKILNPFGFFFEETYWVAGLSSHGELLWENVFGLNNKLAATKMISSPDGNYLFSGADRDPIDLETNYEKQSATVGKVSPQGDLLWLRKYHEEEIYGYTDIFWNVLPTSDGGILCVGSTKPNEEERQNIWVMKLDSLGCAEPGCAIDDAIIGLPIGEADPVILYPNPTAGLFRIGMKEAAPSITRVRINDATGREVFAGDYHQATEVSADLSREPSGLYFCRIEAGGIWYVRQVVKY